MAQDSPGWDWIKRGIEGLWHARYSEAISAFQAACDSNPESPVPHLYLGLSCLQQYVPGALSADVVEHASRAEMELRRTLELDPINWVAFVMLGHLAFQQSRLEAAREWFGKALPVAPRKADIWYTLGMVAFQQWLRQGKRANDTTLDEAILAFETAVELDPVHENAMQCLSLVLRESRKDMAAADRWLEKSADSRAEKVQAAIARPASPPPDPGDPDEFLSQWASMLLSAPPPPPPPPPPSSGLWNRQTSGGSATVRWEPAPRGADPPTPPIRVAPAVQAQKVIAKVDPDYAPDEGVEAPMRFVVVIGNDGHIVSETLISGNIWLLPIAVEALRRWIYEPTLVNGTPVEVVTEVRVEFRAS